MLAKPVRTTIFISSSCACSVCTHARPDAPFNFRSTTAKPGDSVFSNSTTSSWLDAVSTRYSRRSNERFSVRASDSSSSTMSNSFSASCSGTIFLSIFQRCKRQLDRHGGAARLTIVRRYAAAELADHVDDQEQTQPATAPALGRAIGLAEVLQHLGREARPE